MKTPHYREDRVELSKITEYYPVGLAARQNAIGDPIAKTMDVFELLRALMQRSHGQSCLVIANAQSHKDKSQIEAADRAIYEAVQEILAQDEGLAPIPIVLVSDLIIQEEFDALYPRVQNLARQNPQFAEMVYDCVPKSFRPRAHREKALSELPPISHQAAFKAMDYVFQQITQVILMGRHKLGHELEEPYNAVTQAAARLLGISTHRSFETVNLEDSTGTVPYRGVSQPMDEVRENVLSATSDLGILSESWLFRETELDQKYEAIAAKNALMGRLYDLMIEKAPPEIHDAIKFRYAREMITTLLHGPQKVYRFLFEESDALDLLGGQITFAEMEKRAHLLPFQCPRLPEESDYAYFLRFIDALLHNGGPVIPNLGRTGIQYLQCERLHNMAAPNKPGGWIMPFNRYIFELFHKETPAINSPHEEFESTTLNALRELLDIIIGTDLENIYREYLSLPSASADYRPGDRQALQDLLQNEIWGDSFKSFVLPRLSL
jgi:hypothetical protein